MTEIIQFKNTGNQLGLASIISFFLLGTLLAEEDKKEAAEKESPVKLTFMDETAMTGTVHSVDGEKKTLQFSSSVIKGTATLKTAQLLDLQFDHENKDTEADHFALTTIKHRYNEEPPQDTIRGEFIGLDDQYITLDTWYAGQLKLKRSMVEGLNIYQNSPRLFNGPSSFEDWTTSEGKIEDNWTFKQRSFISKSSRTIARKIEVGERMKLSFKVAWKNSPQFYVGFFATTAKANYSPRGYNLRVQTGYLQLYRRGTEGNQMDLFSEGHRGLREQENAVFDFYIDRNPSGKNGLYIDGVKLTEWQDTNDLKGLGDWLVFTPQNNRPMKISNIIVSQWDGQLPVDEEAEEDTGSEEIFEGLSGQRIDLANGDVIVGEVTTIEGGRAKLKTDFGEMLVPIPRLSSFELTPIEDQPRMYTQDVRAWFNEGGSVTLRLDSFTPTTLKGYSQVFGQAEFNLKAFSRIEFNVWSKERESFSNEEDW
ncbi:hypothetical protein N9291_00130 [bacterium]|nr:hypothetical protein [bacterium]